MTYRNVLSEGTGTQHKIVIWNIIEREIQIIDGDQKDDFPLKEVHIKK